MEQLNISNIKNIASIVNYYCGRSMFQDFDSWTFDFIKTLAQIINNISKVQLKQKII